MRVPLPKVRELVEAHHGRIWFDSEVGHGTTFHVELPPQEASTAASESAEPADTADLAGD